MTGFNKGVIIYNYSCPFFFQLFISLVYKQGRIIPSYYKPGTYGSCRKRESGKPLLKPSCLSSLRSTCRHFLGATFWGYGSLKQNKIKFKPTTKFIHNIYTLQKSAKTAVGALKVHSLN